MFPRPLSSISRHPINKRMTVLQFSPYFNSSKDSSRLTGTSVLSKRVFFKALPLMHENILLKSFLEKQFGKVDHIVLTNHTTKSCNALVEFAEKDSAISCVDELNESFVLGRRIRVEFALPTDDVMHAFRQQRNEARRSEMNDSRGSSRASEVETSTSSENNLVL